MINTSQWTRNTRYAIVASILALGSLLAQPLWAADAAAEKADFVGAETCTNCHTGSHAQFKDSVHGRAFSQLKGIEYSKSCETCHGPGSLHAAAAGDKANAGFTTIKNFKKMSSKELGNTCLQCHQDAQRLHWVGGAHESRNVTCITCHSVHDPKESKNLLIKASVTEVCSQCHKEVVSRVKRSAHMPLMEGKMACTSCHNPHGSATKKMIKQESVNATCQGCHADKRGPFLWEHPPVRENCLNCHDPHGSHNERMLATRMPFLCQRCHASPGHPVTPYDRSYLNAAGSRGESQGCANCHINIHGSNHPSGNSFLR